MSSPIDDTVLRQRVRIMQIILLALVGGCLVFMIIAVIVRQGGGMNPLAREPIFTYIALAFGVIVLVNSFILSKIMTSKGRLRIIESTKTVPGTGTIHDETTDLYDLYQTRMIVTAAPREGGAFFLLIAYLIEGTIWSLLGAGLMVIFLLAMFPSVITVNRWVEEQQELLQQERMGI